MFETSHPCFSYAISGWLEPHEWVPFILLLQNEDSYEQWSMYGWFILPKDMFPLLALVESSSLSDPYNQIEYRATSGHILQVQYALPLIWWAIEKHRTCWTQIHVNQLCLWMVVTYRAIDWSKTCRPHRNSRWFWGSCHSGIVGYFWFCHLDLAQHRRKIPILKVLPLLTMQWRHPLPWDKWAGCTLTRMPRPARSLLASSKRFMLKIHLVLTCFGSSWAEEGERRSWFHLLFGGSNATNNVFSPKAIPGIVFGSMWQSGVEQIGDQISRINGISEVSRPKINFRDLVWFQDGFNHLQIVEVVRWNTDRPDHPQSPAQIGRWYSGYNICQQLPFHHFSSASSGSLKIWKPKWCLTWILSNFPCFFNVHEVEAHNTLAEATHA